MLRFLFYANFDNKVGPQLPICVPHPFISLKEFNEIAGYIIPRPSLSHRLISFHWKSNIILNYPIRIEDSKYERHAFFFSFGMVLNPKSNVNSGINDTENTSIPRDEENKDNANTDNAPTNKSETEKDENDATTIEIESYERILKRLTLIFLSLEKDFMYLSKHNKSDHYPMHFKYLNDKTNATQSTKSAINDDHLLRNVLMKIYEGFKNGGECTVNLLESRKIALKLYNELSWPQVINYHDVPVLVSDLSNCIDNRWDIALKYVLKQINSVNHLKRICDILKYKLGDVDNAAVKECIKQLLYYKYIVITDIFQYNNLYIITANINNFINNQQMQRSLLSFILKSDHEHEDDAVDQVMINEIYKMYTRLNGELTIKEFMKRYEWNSNQILSQFDIHKFVLFGTVNKLIRRVHRYPVVVNKEINMQNKSKKWKKLTTLCDGSHCFDEICCALEMNQKQIKTLLLNTQYVVLLK
eukprot:185099_1